MMQRFISVGLCLVGMLFVTAVVFAQSETIVLEQQIGFDVTPPTTPVITSVVPVAATQIDISWSSSTDSGFGVAGYKLFRDTIQIATTSQLTFSDTGLSASTTYSYAVAAFDVAGNVSTTSAAVASTTFAAPVVPPVVATTTPGGSTGGGIASPTLRSIDIIAGVTSAQVQFVTQLPVQYILRYGPTAAVDAATVQSEVYRREHTTYLDELTPNTDYFYELIGIDRYGREEVLFKDRFRTEAAFSIEAPMNVQWFVAEPVADSVSLTWRNPTYDAFRSVRVVRSPYQFPATPNDGFVVYEGAGTSFFDNGAFASASVQYYTIFVYTRDGAYSTGVVAVAQRQQSDRSDVPAIVPDVSGGGDAGVSTNTPSTTADDGVVTSLQFSDLTIVQAGEVLPATEASIFVEAGLPFKVRVPAARFSAAVERLIVIVENPFQARQRTALQLRLNDDGTFYEAVAAPLTLAGSYPLSVRVYDRQFMLLHAVNGSLIVATIEPPVTTEKPLVISFWYIMLSLIVLSLLFFILGRTFGRAQRG